MKKLEPNTRLNRQKSSGTNKENSALVARIMDAMWSGPLLADAFLKNRKDWQKDLAASLSVPLSSIERGVGAFGVDALKKLIVNHPSGEPPSAVVRSPSRHGYGLPTNTDVQFCNTGNSCGTCATYCGSNCTCVRTKSVYAL